MKLWALLAGLVFFIAGLLTLSDYGIMWDARAHFIKGQAYANFFLSGRRTYEDLPVTSDNLRYYRDYASRREIPFSDPSWRLSPDPSYRRSIYQDDFHNYNWYAAKKSFDHPPLSAIGAAFFNILFYEKLGLLRDDHAYHLFSVVLASILVALVFYWALMSYGWFAAIITSLALATYPLFWAESHFNIKDIPQTVFFSMAIWAFWRGLISRSSFWIMGSAVAAGCAFATKFNAVFLPFILIPWLILFYLNQAKRERFRYHRYWWLIFTYPLIMFGVLFISFPFLWHNTLTNFLKLVAYYRGIGTNIDYTPNFRILFGFNTYAPAWILLTTYPWVIFLAIIGIFGALVNAWRSKDFLPLLFVFWLLVPILRVFLPRTAIYGGVRQIMEYIPAMAILAGSGANYMSTWLHGYMAKAWKRKPSDHLTIGSLRLIQIVIILLFIPLLINLIRYHPAENAYFNSLIGGLAGAKKAEITQWGNTFGSVYHQGIVWLNANAEPNSHVATAFSDPADFYLPELREDIRADQQFSGFLQEGEYVVGLTHHSELENTYQLRYLENYLEPVYVYEIDHVPLLKIWKNDKQYLKKEIQSLKEQSLILLARKEKNYLNWDLGQVERVIWVEIEFKQTPSCQPIELAYFQISQDNEEWEILPETYPGGPIDVLPHQPQSGKLIAPIAALPARSISLVVEPKDACLLKPTMSKIFILGE